MDSPRIYRKERGKTRESEYLYVAFGQSDSGRYLAVSFILKSGDVGEPRLFQRQGFRQVKDERVVQRLDGRLKCGHDILHRKV